MKNTKNNNKKKKKTRSMKDCNFFFEETKKDKFIREKNKKKEEGIIKLIIEDIWITLKVHFQEETQLISETMNYNIPNHFGPKKGLFTNV